MSSYYIFDNDENRWCQGHWTSFREAHEEMVRLTEAGGSNASFSLFMHMDGEAPPL